MQEYLRDCAVGDIANRHHAYLWIGNRSNLIEKVKSFFKKKWCLSLGCDCCLVCKQIEINQHHAFTWLCPEKQLYTTNQIDCIQHVLSFGLDGDESFFIVLERAEALSPATANKLLKSLEEPPSGYYFILLAESAEMILPTIASRCVITVFSDALDNEENRQKEEFKQLLCEPQKSDLASLYQQYEKISFDEQQTVSFLSDLLVELMAVYKKHIEMSSDTENAQDINRDIIFRMIFLIQEMLQHAPMPGSLKIFWRTFLMRISGICHSCGAK